MEAELVESPEGTQRQARHAQAPGMPAETFSIIFPIQLRKPAASPLSFADSATPMPGHPRGESGGDPFTAVSFRGGIASFLSFS